MALFQLSPYEIKEIKGSLPRHTGLLQLSSEHPSWSSSLILYPGYTAANLSSVPSSNDRRFNEDFKWNITDSGSLTILFNLTMLNNQVMFNFHITGYQYFETSASDSRSLRFFLTYAIIATLITTCWLAHLKIRYVSHHHSTSGTFYTLSIYPVL